MQRSLPVLAAIVLIVSLGVAEGFWSNRWHTSHELDDAVARLGAVPLAVGTWQGQPDQGIDPRALEIGEIKGYLSRQYVQQGTGATLSVLVVCGQPGPIAVHTPDVCYAGAGYGLVGPAVRHSVNADALAAPAEFWLGKFQKAGATPEPLHILWSWSAAGDWVAADNPRVQFARHKYLYKLYVVRHLVGADEPADKDPSSEFLRLFLPQLRAGLFPGA